MITLAAVALAVLTTLTATGGSRLGGGPASGSARAGGGLATAPQKPDDAWRNTKPSAAPAPAFTPPKIERFTLDGTKLEVFLVERHELPIVEMSLVWDVGRVDDPADKAGLYGLCFDLLDEGTATLDKSAFEEKKADIAARISMSSSNETSAASLSITKDRLAPAMALFSEMLTKPGLREADLERQRARHIAGVIQSRASVDSIGGRVMGRVFWGEKHALGRVTTDKSLAAITKKDCEQIAKRLLPDGAKLYVAGDLTASEIQALFRAHLPAWRGAGPKALAYGGAASLKGRYFFIDVPGAQQSRVAILQPGPMRAAPEYTVNAVMLQIYGGGFSSRVNMNLREKNGYTYGARGGASYHRRGAMVSTSSSVRTDVTEASLREIAKELSGMRAPTDAELSREREGALLAFPAQFATGSSTLGAASEVIFYGLTFDEWSRHLDALVKVDASSVEDAAKRVLKPTDSLVFVVGDKAVVKPALEAIAKEGLFGKGALVELDADGNLKK